MSSFLHCYASAAFGLEGLVSAELKQLSLQDVRAENGGVFFSADPDQLFLCNLRLHTTDRLFVILASGECRTFDSLFRLVETADWASFFSGSDAINVSCKCSRSVLMSMRDCQSITKKAIIEKIKKQTGQAFFPENGNPLPVHVSIRNNEARILLNVSGPALSRRGYRTWNGEAPLRETLAAALVELSPWKPGMPFHDPCCGTGTILIEAAFLAANRAPGLKRQFSMESIRFFKNTDFLRLRKMQESEADLTRIRSISGSDISSEAIDLARRHVCQAGLDPHSVSLSQTPLQELSLDCEKGVFICNPPYGERLGDQQQCRELYRDLRLLKERHPAWKLCAISSDPAFERAYGKRADKKRRLYNGRLECVFYTYY